MVDARDLKSLGEKSLCRFESGRPHQIHKLLIFAVAVVGFVGLIGHADKSAAEEAAPRSNGARVELSGFVLACRDLDVLQKGMTFAEQKDLEATREYFLDKMLSGECQAAQPGTKVILQDSRNSSFVCIRKLDEPDCYWAMRYTVEPADTLDEHQGRGAPIWLEVGVNH